MSVEWGVCFAEDKDIKFQLCRSCGGGARTLRQRNSCCSHTNTTFSLLLWAHTYRRIHHTCEMCRACRHLIQQYIVFVNISYITAPNMPCSPATVTVVNHLHHHTPVQTIPLFPCCLLLFTMKPTMKKYKTKIYIMTITNQFFFVVLPPPPNKPHYYTMILRMV